MTVYDLRAMESGLRENYYLALLAEAHAMAGRVEVGLRLLDEAAAVTDERESPGGSWSVAGNTLLNPADKELCERTLTTVPQYI